MKSDIMDLFYKSGQDPQTRAHVAKYHTGSIAWNALLFGFGPQSFVVWSLRQCRVTPKPRTIQNHTIKPATIPKFSASFDLSPPISPYPEGRT